MAITKYPKYANTIPGVQTTVNDSAITGTSSSSDKKLMLVGTSEGGEPGVVYKFTNYSNAKDVLRSGDLLDAIQLAWNPTPDGTYYAGDILATRAQPATQASLVEGPLTFTSDLYSSLANEIQVSLTDNLITNTKRLNIRFNTDNVNTTYDNLGNVLVLSYSGTFNYASAQVHHDDTGYADTLTLKAGASPSTATVVSTIDLGSSSAQPKLGDLINTINNISGFTADFFSVGNHNIYSYYLDSTDEVPLKTSETTFTALAGDILNAVEYDNTVSVSYDPFGGVVSEPTNVSVNVSNGVATITATAETAEVPVTNFSATNLTGGSTGISPSSWANYFNLFSNEDGAFYIVPLTADQSIQSEANAYVQAQANLANPMRVIVGGGISESKKEAISRAAQLDSDRGYLVANSVQITNATTGTTASYPAYMAAAMVAGIASGLPKGDSVTYKYLNIVGCDVTFDIDDLNSLDGAGVIAIQHVRNSSSTSSFRITDDVSTYASNGSTSPVDTEMGVGEASDMIVTAANNYIDNNLIGQKVAANSPSTIKTKMLSFLDGAITDGLIYAYDASNVTVTTINQDGSKWQIDMVVDISRNIKHVSLGLVYDQSTLSTSTSTS